MYTVQRYNRPEGLVVVLFLTYSFFFFFLSKIRSLPLNKLRFRCRTRSNLAEPGKNNTENRRPDCTDQCERGELRGGEGVQTKYREKYINCSTRVTDLNGRLVGKRHFPKLCTLSIAYSKFFSIFKKNTFYNAIINIIYRVRFVRIRRLYSNPSIRH